jgi:hypothetical protein
VRSLFSVGFCFGGALSYLQARAGSAMRASSASTAGRWAEALADRPRPIDAVPRYANPVQSIFGGADEGIPASAVEEFDGACQKARVRTDAKTYAGRAAQLLRPQADGVRGGLRGRVGPGEELVGRNTKAASGDHLRATEASAQRRLRVKTPGAGAPLRREAAWMVHVRGGEDVATLAPPSSLPAATGWRRAPMRHGAGIRPGARKPPRPPGPRWPGSARR